MSWTERIASQGEHEKLCATLPRKITVEREDHPFANTFDQSTGPSRKMAKKMIPDIPNKPRIRPVGPNTVRTIKTQKLSDNSVDISSFSSDHSAPETVQYITKMIVPNGELKHELDHGQNHVVHYIEQCEPRNTSPNMPEQTYHLLQEQVSHEDTSGSIVHHIKNEGDTRREIDVLGMTTSTGTETACVSRNRVELLNIANLQSAALHAAQ